MSAMLCGCVNSREVKAAQITIYENLNKPSIRTPILLTILYLKFEIVHSTTC